MSKQLDPVNEFTGMKKAILSPATRWNGLLLINSSPNNSLKHLSSIQIPVKMIEN